MICIGKNQYYMLFVFLLVRVWSEISIGHPGRVSWHGRAKKNEAITTTTTATTAVVVVVVVVVV